MFKGVFVVLAMFLAVAVSQACDYTPVSGNETRVSYFPGDKHCKCGEKCDCPKGTCPNCDKAKKSEKKAKLPEKVVKPKSDDKPKCDGGVCPNCPSCPSCPNQAVVPNRAAGPMSACPNCSGGFFSNRPHILGRLFHRFFR